MKTYYFFKRSITFAVFFAFALSFQSKAQQATIDGIIYQAVAVEGGESYAETVALPRSGDSHVPYTAESITIQAKVTIGGVEYPVRKIGDNSMRENPNLKSVTLPDGLETIGNSSFAQCPEIKEVVVPASVKAIEDWAFYGCPNLEKINIPDGITAITEHTFQQTGLTSVELPASVTTLGVCAFQTARKLASINLENVTDIKSWALGETALTSAVAEKVRFLGSNAFFACPELESAVLGSAVQTGEWSFQNCAKLTEITLPNTLESIDGGTFSGCSSLKSIVIPSSVLFLGAWAFEKTAITEIFASWEKPDDLITDANIFGADEGQINFTWKVPESLRSLYGDEFLGYPVETGEPSGNEPAYIRAEAFYSAGNLIIANLSGYNAFVYSSDGRSVSRFSINDSRQVVPLSLPSGVYFFHAVKGGKTATARFLVR
ncbi:MAG: leucine-rich repeat domain-containing protein [Tannerella sp.]|jgi:hypothetical protein|nr:leucine-rich repeat domain-containing protein [Tannerella sp.]